MHTKREKQKTMSHFGTFLKTFRDAFWSSFLNSIIRACIQSEKNKKKNDEPFWDLSEDISRCILVFFFEFDNSSMHSKREKQKKNDTIEYDRTTMHERREEVFGAFLGAFWKYSFMLISFLLCTGRRLQETTHFFAFLALQQEWHFGIIFDVILEL